MHLLPREVDKLTLLRPACVLAQTRLLRGCLLSYTEAVALLSGVLLEKIRDGQYTVPDLMRAGRRILGFSHVCPGVERLLHEVAVEGTFPDGTKLVTLHDPICTPHGDLSWALYGCGLYLGTLPVFQERAHAVPYDAMPGCVIGKKEPIPLHPDKPRYTLYVLNTGDRPVQVSLPSQPFLIDFASHLLCSACHALPFHL